MNIGLHVDYPLF